MSRPSIITSPRPTAEETAKLLGVPDNEVKKVRALVDRWVHNPETLSRFGEPRIGHAASPKLKLTPAKR